MEGDTHESYSAEGIVQQQPFSVKQEQGRQRERTGGDTRLLWQVQTILAQGIKQTHLSKVT